MGALPQRSRSEDAESLESEAERLAIQAIRSSDVGAFESLYQQHYHNLTTFAVRYTAAWDSAEDLVQDVFAKIWAKRDTLPNILALRAYLYGAVRNAALNVQKHEARVTRIHGWALHTKNTLGVADHAVGQDRAVEQADLRERMQYVLERLPERQHAAIVLRYEHDLSYSGIAEVLEISDVAARKLVRKGEDHLRDAFEGTIL